MKIALQLYSVRDDAARDFPGTLARVAALGYQGVEFAGYFGIPADVMKGHLDRLGLVAASTHVGIELLEGGLDAQIAYAKAVGCRYLVCPGAHVTNKDEILALAKRLSAMAPKVRAAGLVLGYHNHAHEFFAVEGPGTGAARNGMDLLYASTSPADLIVEADTHWVQRADHAPRAFLRTYAGRVPLIHLKDMSASREDDAAVGEGIMDIRGIWDTSVECGVEWAIVEMDTASFEAVSLGIANLRKMGLVG